MAPLRTTIGVGCVVTVIVGHSLWTTSAQSFGTARTAPHEWNTTAILEPTIDDPGLEAEPPRVDKFGNDVEAAMGDYRVDRRGEIFERHSPNTEVPHLASPVL